MYIWIESWLRRQCNKGIGEITNLKMSLRIAMATSLWSHSGKKFHLWQLFSFGLSTCQYVSRDESSIAPENSVSQRVEQSLATDFFESNSTPESVGEYFIVKNTPESLEKAKRLLSKKASVCKFHYSFNCISSLYNLVFLQSGIEIWRNVARILRMCWQKKADSSRCLQILS